MESHRQSSCRNEIFRGGLDPRSSHEKTSQITVINVAAALTCLMAKYAHSLDVEARIMTIDGGEDSTRRHRKSNALYLQGEICQGIFVVVHGVVTLSTGIANRQVRVASCHEGAVLGLAETIAGGTYQTRAIAVTDVTKQFISKTDVLNAIAGDPTAGHRFLLTLTADLEDLYRRIRRIAAAPAKRSTVRNW